MTPIQVDMRKEKLFEREWEAGRLVQVVKETGVEGRGGEVLGLGG